MKPLALTLVLAAASLSPAFAGTLPPTACASGYHVDRGGNCQPDNGEQNRYCPRGLVFHPSFYGWTCDPPPPQAY